MILLINGTDQGSLQPYQKKKGKKRGVKKQKSEKGIQRNQNKICVCSLLEVSIIFKKTVNPSYSQAEGSRVIFLYTPLMATPEGRTEDVMHFCNSRLEILKLSFWRCLSSLNEGLKQALCCKGLIRCPRYDNPPSTFTSARIINLNICT